MSFQNYLVVHDGLKFVVFEIISSIAARESSSFVVVGSFNSCAQHACVYNKNIYTFEPVKNVVRNLQVIQRVSIIDWVDCLMSYPGPIDS